MATSASATASTPSSAPPRAARGAAQRCTRRASRWTSCMRFVSRVGPGEVRQGRGRRPRPACESLAFGYELLAKTYVPPAPPLPTPAHAPGPRSSITRRRSVAPALVPLLLVWALASSAARAPCCASPPRSCFVQQGRGPAHVPAAAAARRCASLAVAAAVVAIARPQERDARVTRPARRGHRHRDRARPLHLDGGRRLPPAEPPPRGQGGAHRVHHQPRQRPHRPGGVRRRGLHAGAADAGLRRAQGGGEAAAHPRARGRHRHRRRAGHRRSTACATRTPRAGWWCSSPTATTTPGKISPLDAAAMAQGAAHPGLHHPRRQGRQGALPRRARTCSATPCWREIGDPDQPRAAPGRSPTTTGGEYYRATDRESLKQGLQKVLDSLERSQADRGRRDGHLPRGLPPASCCGVRARRAGAAPARHRCCGCSRDAAAEAPGASPCSATRLGLAQPLLPRAVRGRGWCWGCIGAVRCALRRRSRVRRAAHRAARRRARARRLAWRCRSVQARPLRARACCSSAFALAQPQCGSQERADEAPRHRRGGGAGRLASPCSRATCSPAAWSAPSSS